MYAKRDDFNRKTNDFSLNTNGKLRPDLEYIMLRTLVYGEKKSNINVCLKCFSYMDLASSRCSGSTSSLIWCFRGRSPQKHLLYKAPVLYPSGETKQSKTKQTPLALKLLSEGRRGIGLGKLVYRPQTDVHETTWPLQDTYNCFLSFYHIFQGLLIDQKIKYLVLGINLCLHNH